MADTVQKLTEDKIYIKKIRNYSDTEYDVQMAKINDDSTKSMLYPITKLDNVVDNTGKKLTDILNELI